MNTPQVVRRVYNMQVLVEDTPAYIQETADYTFSAISNSTRHIKRGAAVISLYDESDHLNVLSFRGQASPELQRRVEGIFEPDYK